MNPFILGNIEPGEPFCDRRSELAELSGHALNCAHVLLYSPRRIGKTSLVKQVARKVASPKHLVIFSDLFAVSNEAIFIQKLFSSVAGFIGKDISSKTLSERIGQLFMRIVPTIEIKPDGFSISARYDPGAKPTVLLDDIFGGLKKYLQEENKKCLLIFDEFQEITALKEGKFIEGTIRGHLQGSRDISCFFVGSRRRILKDMFDDKSRPLYKLALQYPLGKIPKTDLADYIYMQFDQSGKICPLSLAEKVFDYAEGYTFYVQKLAHLFFDMADGTATEEVLAQAQKKLMQMESPEFESIYAGLSNMEKRALLAFAAEPTASPFSKDFMAKYGFSIGGLRNVLKSLFDKDHIEKDLEGRYSLTDPMFSKWCRSVMYG